MTSDVHEIFIDPDIPADQQIAFLRTSNISARMDTYLVLKEELGEAGVALFKKILRRGYEKIVDMTKDFDFETMASCAAYSDHILGLRSALDYAREDEFQYSVTACPYLDECTRRGIDAGFCHVFEEVYIDVMNRHIGEFTEPARMCSGDSMCVFKMKRRLCALP